MFTDSYVLHSGCLHSLVLLAHEPLPSITANPPSIKVLHMRVFDLPMDVWISMAQRLSVGDLIALQNVCLVSVKLCFPKLTGLFIDLQVNLRPDIRLFYLEKRSR